MARLGVAVIRACGLVAPPRPPASELRLTGERHTPGRDRRAVAYHYDAGNDFFSLFLDPSMTYSCAYFQGGADTLADAQQAKLGLVCTKLGPAKRASGCSTSAAAGAASRSTRPRTMG